SSGAGTYSFANVMLNEGSIAEQFVAGVKHNAGTWIKRHGLNEFPPFYEWALQSTAQVKGPYELQHVIASAGSGKLSSIEFSVVGGQTYHATADVEIANYGGSSGAYL